MQEVTGQLENWYYDNLFNVIYGEIHSDLKRRFVDGTIIHTSDIPLTRKDRKDIFNEGDIVETLNSRYLLGKRK